MQNRQFDGGSGMRKRGQGAVASSNLNPVQSHERPPMKLSKLLLQRGHLLQQMRLANFAFAYQTLTDFAARVARADLSGSVTLRPAAPEQDRFIATLVAHEMSQSRIEEHFTDEDLMLLADVLAFATGHPAVELSFHLEQLEADFIAPLRGELIRAGVELEEREQQFK